MLEDLRELLKDDGLLALNFFGYAGGPGATPAVAVAKTIDAVFPSRRVFVSSLTTELTDHVFLASMNPLEFQPEQVDAASSRRGRLILESLLENETDIPRDRGFVITDDFNSLESLQMRKAEVYWSRFVSDVGADLLAR